MAVIVAVEKATACGAEITLTCGNQKVQLSPLNIPSDNSGTNNANVIKKSQSNGGILRNLLPSIGNMFGGSNHGAIDFLSPRSTSSNTAVTVPTSPTRLPSSSSPTPPEDNLAYLNVHAGVSVGLMAGIDIGASNRW
eukprot:gene35306-43529_t